MMRNVFSIVICIVICTVFGSIDTTLQILFPAISSSFPTRKRLVGFFTAIF